MSGVMKHKDKTRSKGIRCTACICKRCTKSKRLTRRSTYQGSGKRKVTQASPRSQSSNERPADHMGN